MTVSPRSDEPVLLFDMMDTLVLDPFRDTFPDVLGMSMETLTERARPGVWPDFERGRIDEAMLAARYFRDGTLLDVDRIKTALFGGYAWIEGIEPVLAELRDADVQMHVMSNYPAWYHPIEERLGVSRYLPWTFVSCDTGRRKPDQDAFEYVAKSLDVEPRRLVLVDDREMNCEGARRAGMDAIRFTSATALRGELERRI